MKRIICILLVMLMALSVLSACNDNKINNESSEVQSSAASEEESSSVLEEDKPYGWDLPVKDLGGRVFRILCRDWTAGSTSIVGYNGEVIQRDTYDEKTADIVDIAKHEVRVEIENKYNCSIEGQFSSATPADFNSEVMNTVYAGGDYVYDMVFDAYGHAYPLITENVYVDLNSIKTIDLNNPWWDQNARKDLSICNKLYFMCGDINTYDNDGTWVLYFNKELAAKALPGVDLYQLVYDNEWCFDKFVEITKTVSSDTDGVDGMSEFDTWGLGTETYNAFVHMLASGQKIVQKDSEDIPYLSFQNERMYTVLGDIMSFYTDKNSVMVANDGRFGDKYANVWEDTIIKAFRDGRELFYMGGLINIVGYRTLEFPFGLLPIPKHDKEQDSYYHSVSMHNMSCLLIPAVSDNYDDLGLVIEALGAASKNDLTPVYYEKCLKGKYASAVDDEKMLDIIFSSRCFDLGSVFNWGGVLSQFMTLDMNYASRFDSIADKAQSELEETLEFFKK